MLKFGTSDCPRIKIRILLPSTIWKISDRFIQSTYSSQYLCGKDKASSVMKFAAVAFPWSAPTLEAEAESLVL